MRGTVQFTQDRRSVCCLLININVDSEACQLTRHVRHAQIHSRTRPRTGVGCSVLFQTPTLFHIWQPLRLCPPVLAGQAHAHAQGLGSHPSRCGGGKGGALPPGRALETQQGGPYIFPLSPPPFSSPSFPLSFRGGQHPLSLSPIDNTMTERQTSPDLVDQDRRHRCLNARPLRQGVRSVGNPQLNPHGRRRSRDRHLQSRSSKPDRRIVSPPTRFIPPPTTHTFPSRPNPPPHHSSLDTIHLTSNSQRCSTHPDTHSIMLLSQTPTAGVKANTRRTTWSSPASTPSNNPPPAMFKQTLPEAHIPTTRFTHTAQDLPLLQLPLT